MKLYMRYDGRDFIVRDCEECPHGVYHGSKKFYCRKITDFIKVETFTIHPDCPLPDYKDEEPDHNLREAGI